MTIDQHKQLMLIFARCDTFDRNKKDIATRERQVRIIDELNLTPDEYEYAVAKVAGIIGV